MIAPAVLYALAVRRATNSADRDEALAVFAGGQPDLRFDCDRTWSQDGSGTGDVTSPVPLPHN